MQKKSEPVANGTRVVGEVGDLDGGRMLDLGRPERRDQAVELHRRNSWAP